jgi:hypothetical protein
MCFLAASGPNKSDSIDHRSHDELRSNDPKLRDSGGRARCLRGGLCGEQAA